MATFIVESFNNGLDLRKSANTAPPGSLRVLRNAFVNEGGEIEKRKAFVRHDELINYTSSLPYKGRVSGPHPIAGQEDAVFFRHRDNTLPGSPWVAGTGTQAVRLDLSGDEDRPMTAWAMKSALSLPLKHGLLRAESVSAYATHMHVLETFSDGTSGVTRVSEHVDITRTLGGEPTAEAVVTANANRNYLITLRSKGYVLSFRGHTLFASVVDNPGDMGPGTGSGSVDLRTQGVPIGTALALAEYFGQLVIVGARGAQFWEVDPDFAKNQYLRSIALSLFGRRTVTPYLYGDILYLASNGVRSLRAQDSSNVAHVQDVGSPIDKLIRAAINYGESATEDVSIDLDDERKNAFFYGELAITAVHLQTGQFWLCLKDKIYVLTVFPDAKVRAWSVFDLPVGVSLEKYDWVADICPIYDDLIFRTFGDEVYIYGGTTGVEYDVTEAEVVTPYMDMGSPSTTKTLHGLDIACDGTWTVAISTDINNEIWQTLGTVTESTHRLGDMIPIDMELTHFALRLTSTSMSAAKVGQIAITYSGGDEK